MPLLDDTINQGDTGKLAWAEQVATKLNAYVDVVADFGAVGDGVTDDTAAIQLAIDTVEALGGGIVFFPAGTYLVTKLTLANKVSLIGAQAEVTFILSATSAEPALVVLPVGPVTFPRIENLTFVGNAANAGQHCFYMYAQTDGTHGGLWYGTFRNLIIGSVADPFLGHSIWLRGGTTAGPEPDQFNVFENLLVTRGASAASRALLMTGQCGQNRFSSCEFAGQAEGTGTNVELSRQFTNGGTVGGSTVGGAADGDGFSYTTTFDLCTFQTSEYGCQQDRAQMTRWDNCYFENLDRSIFIIAASYGNRISGYFQNAGANGGGTGYCVGVDSTSEAQLEQMIVGGTFDKIVSAANDWGVRIGAVTSNADTVGKTSGITVQVSESSGELTTHWHDNILLQPSATTIDTITSYLTPGTDLIMRVHFDTPNYVIFGPGGNISLPNGLAVQARPGDVLVFHRADLGADWMLKSHSITGMADVIATASLPAEGTAQNGRLVIEDAGTGDRNLIIYAGGQRFRIDGGAGF